MTEQELIDQLAAAEKEVINAKRGLADAKKRWTDAETELINSKLHRDRIKEALRVHRNTVPKYEPSLRDLDIERFRQENQELCEWARQRDIDKANQNE